MCPRMRDFLTIGCRVFDDEESRRVSRSGVVEKRMQFSVSSGRDAKTGAVRQFSGWLR
jgi:hypothetical protein